MLYWLYFLQDDVENEEFRLVIGYFDISKLIEVQVDKKSNQLDKKKTKFKVAFDPLISKALERYCDIIHWTPEEFIEDTAEWKIDSILSDIKNGDYEFLKVYLNFSKAIESIEKIEEDESNEDEN